MNRLILIILSFLIGCKSLSESKNNLSQNREIKTDTVSNKFTSFYEQIPSINLPVTLGKDKLPEIDYNIVEVLNQSEFADNIGQPYGKIERDNFIAIFFGQAVQGESDLLVTFTKEGKRINDVLIYEFYGYDVISSPYKNEETCITKIDKNLNIHFYHKSVLLKVDKSDLIAKDSIVRDNVIKDFKIDDFGKIIKIK